MTTATPGTKSNSRDGGLRSWRLWVGWLLIGSGAVITLLFRFQETSPTRLLPLYQKTVYQVHAMVDGRPLTSSGTIERYRLPISGTTTLSPAGLKSVVRNRESADAAGEQIYVRLHGREDGGNESIWLWPEN